MPRHEKYREALLDEAFFGDELRWRGDGTFLLSLHSGAPYDATGRLQNEARYLGYRAVEIARSRKAWMRDGTTVRNRAEIRFPLCDEAESGRHRLTHWALRPRSGGAYRHGELAKPVTAEAMTHIVIDVGTLEVSEE